MKKVVCDKCGAKRPDPIRNISGDRKAAENGEWGIIDHRKCKLDCHTKRIDLCDGCYYEFKEILIKFIALPQ